MKKLIGIGIIIFSGISVFAQLPQKMSYQAIIRNSSNSLVKSSPVTIRISILQGTSSGTAVYVETQTSVTDADGLVTVEIGGGNIVTGTLVAIDWSNGPYFIKTETDPEGGTTYSITGTSQLLSVPYAFYSNAAGSSSDAVKLTGDQTIAGNKTFTGTISANSQKITNVANPVNDQDAATKTYVDVLQTQISMLKNTLKAGGIVTDIEGNSYNTVVIGTQTWMAENLKTTKYNDNTNIPLVTDNVVWSSLTTPAYCWYNNDVSTYKATYGGLYNWHVVDKASNGGKNVCPTGWHVPDMGEWNVLWYPFKMNYNPDPLNNKIGKELMETGTTHWIKPWGTNETGFTALPGGSRSYDGIYSGIGGDASFWSSNMWPGEFASYRFPLPISESYGSSPLSMSESWKAGLTIRCLKD